MQGCACFANREKIATMIPWRLKSILRWGVGRARDAAGDAIRSLYTHDIPLPARVARKKVILVGASVGKAWRLHLVYPNIRTFALYDFDKTPSIRKAIAARPDAIIIKECAAYFPSPEVDRALVEGWIRQIRSAGIRPVLATVVPVTRAHAQAHPGRADGLWAFNDWLRELAAAESIPLLDLEARLRISDADRHLVTGLDDGDGLHLARTTYRHHMDQLILPLLLRIFDKERT